ADRHEAQRQRAEIQFRFDARAFPVLPREVELDPGSEKDESERDGQQENQRRNGPEQIGLAEIFRRFFKLIEGNLPDDKRGQDREQLDARAEKKTLAHAAEYLATDYIEVALCGSGILAGRGFSEAAR